MKTRPAWQSAKHGQAMIESLLVVILSLFCFLIIFQYGHAVSTKLLMTHAAGRAARSRTVGFNEWMVEKSARVAMIPLSGRRLVPEESQVTDAAALLAISQMTPGEAIDAALRTRAGHGSAQFELARIPEYLSSINSPTAAGVLNYEKWPDLSYSIDEDNSEFGGTIRVDLRFFFPSLLPGMGQPASRPDGNVEAMLPMNASYEIESHYPLYLEGSYW